MQTSVLESQVTFRVKKKAWLKWTWNKLVGCIRFYNFLWFFSTFAENGCEDNYVEFFGECVQFELECDSGYRRYNPTTDDLECAECDDACEDCVGPGDHDCLKCTEGTHHLTADGRCIECGEGYFVMVETSMCLCKHKNLFSVTSLNIGHSYWVYPYTPPHPTQSLAYIFMQRVVLSFNLVLYVIMFQYS